MVKEVSYYFLIFFLKQILFKRDLRKNYHPVTPRYKHLSSLACLQYHFILTM